MSRMNQHPKDRLRRVSFLRNLTDEALDLVLGRMVRRSVPSGSILFRKGERARGVYILVRGRVEIFRCTSDGREQIIHSEVPVQSVAELPVFDGGEYPASARTAEDSELYFLSLQDFQRLYREHPEIADAVIQNLGLRLRKLVTLLETVSLRSIPSRVAKTLLDVAERAGRLRDGGTFRMPRTQTELAHELATTRESVARALGQFRKKGLIHTDGPEVTLLSVRGLEDLASGE